MATPSSGTDPSSTTDLPGTNTDTTATASSAGTYTTATGASAATKADTAATGPTSRTPEGGGGGGISVGAIVGSVIGALALMGMLLGIVLFIWMRSRKEKKKRDAAEPEPVSPAIGPDDIIVAPYRSGARVSAPPLYDGRPSMGPGEAKSPPPRPARSPEKKKINLTEGGWF
ncbi:hypothetical protein CGRA01v4_12986 [Colletotrichum graminicola]|nr:hypothetical protein CGRA01v4_12986 [Colletotrichum graminicola]